MSNAMRLNRVLSPVTLNMILMPCTFCKYLLSNTWNHNVHVRCQLTPLCSGKRSCQFFTELSRSSPLKTDRHFFHYTVEWDHAKTYFDAIHSLEIDCSRRRIIGNPDEISWIGIIRIITTIILPNNLTLAGEVITNPMHIDYLFGTDKVHSLFTEHWDISRHCKCTFSDH